MLLVVLVAAYFLGAVPFALLVGRAVRGVDVRRAGSGNTGAMNTLRSAGVVAGVLVALLDAGKAALAVVVGRWLLGPNAGALAGCIAVVGHCFSPYLIASSWREWRGNWKRALRGTGGKGLASGMGVLAALAWPSALAAVAAFGLAFAILRKDATWPSVIGSFAAVPAVWFWTGSAPANAASLVVAILVAVKHLPDLREGFWVEAQE